MKKPAFLITPNSVTMVFENSTPVVVDRSEATYIDIISALRSSDWERAHELAFPGVYVQKELSKALGEGNVFVTAEQVTYKGQPLNNIVATRILSLLHDGFDVMPMVRFLDRLMKNPSFTAVQELLMFIEASNLPIDDDGYFYAYKRITSDWLDVYTKSIDNSIGTTVEMPRNLVDDKRENTCSSGLHFCAFGYLSSYGADRGGRVVIVKIDPADVVSIPSDYNNQKGRCCKYVVVREVELQDRSHESLPEERIEGVILQDSPTSGRMIAQIIPLTGAVKQYFDSVSAATKATGIDSSSISKVLRGQRQSAGGFGWVVAGSTDASTLPHPNNKIPDDRFNVKINYQTGQYFQKQPEYEDLDEDEDDEDWEDEYGSRY